MATFKVGQRVRIIFAAHKSIIGDEVYIVGPLGCDPAFPGHYEISIPAHCPWRHALQFFAPPDHLAPLTDPGEESWAADAVRKVTKPEPVAPKVPEKVTT